MTLFRAFDRDGNLTRAHRVSLIRVWQRIVACQKEIFYTTRRYPFTYSVEGSGIWFYRKGERINMRLARSEVEAAIARCPLEKTTDIKDLRDFAYLFGLLMDRRIRGEDW